MDNTETQTEGKGKIVAMVVAVIVIVGAFALYFYVQGRQKVLDSAARARQAKADKAILKTVGDAQNN